MLKELKKMQRKHKKKKMLAQRSKVEKAQSSVQSSDVSVKSGTKSARPVSGARSASYGQNSGNMRSASEQKASAHVQETANVRSGAGSKASSQSGVEQRSSVRSGSGVKTSAGTRAAGGTRNVAGVKGSSDVNPIVTGEKKKSSGAKSAGAAKKKQMSKGYHERLRQHRRDVIKRGAAVAAIAIGVLVIIGFFMERGSYHNYRILQTSEQEDVISTKYVELDGKILRYSPEGAALVDSKLQTHWSALYDMENPIADVNGEAAVIADRDGTTMKIFDKDGLTGSVTTSYNIVKAHISEKGLVAAILDGGDETWINYYASDGSLIAENQTKVEDPGYPMDVAVSDDGMVMMIAYQFVDGGDTTSYVAFYNFGDVGQNEDDRIVSGYTYDGIVIPQVQYLADNRSVALRDDGFTIYKGKQIPKENTTVEVEGEIVSTFYDDDLIGLVFKSGEKDKPYTMKVYSTAGKLKFEKDFNIPYTTIKMSGDHIIMYNSSQMCVLNSRGVEKYSGTIDGTIKDFFKIGWNRYLLVLDTGVNVVKFS